MKGTSAKSPSGLLAFPLLIRVAGAFVAIGCFFTGLRAVFSDPAQGLILMGLGVVAGLICGRVPRSPNQLVGKRDAG